MFARNHSYKSLDSGVQKTTTLELIMVPSDQQMVDEISTRSKEKVQSFPLKYQVKWRDYQTEFSQSADFFGAGHNMIQ